MGRITVYPELEPARKAEIVLERVVRLIRAYGRIDIPDIPLGKPSISSPVLGVYAMHRLGADAIVHLRVQDHNILSLKSIIKTLSYIGPRRILLLRGDPPRQGSPCPSWSPEEAVAYASRYGMETGLLLSPRKSLEEIRERISVGAQVYYITRASRATWERVTRIIGMVLGGGATPALYLTVATGSNRGYLEENMIPYVEASELEGVIARAEALGVARIILSAPGDGDYLYSSELVERLRGMGLV